MTGDETRNEGEIREKVKTARRKFHSVLIAVAPTLEQPYPDDARWSPWTRFVRPMIDHVDQAFDALLAELSSVRAEAARPSHTQGGDRFVYDGIGKRQLDRLRALLVRKDRDALTTWEVVEIAADDLAAARAELVEARRKLAEPTARKIAEFSRWIESTYRPGMDRELVMRRRIDKLTEELGEVMEAVGLMVGENPRKGVQGCADDVVRELLDVAACALGAIEHFNGHSGECMEQLADHVSFVHERAGLAAVGSGDTEPATKLCDEVHPTAGPCVRRGAHVQHETASMYGSTTVWPYPAPAVGETKDGQP